MTRTRIKPERVIVNITSAGQPVRTCTSIMQAIRYLRRIKAGGWNTANYQMQYTMPDGKEFKETGYQFLGRWA